MALLLVTLANGVPRPEVVVGIFSSMIGLTAVFAIVYAAQKQAGRPSTCTRPSPWSRFLR